MRVLLTGASGFVGQWIARALVEAGVDVVAPSRSGARVEERLDLEEADSIERAVSSARPDVVVNAAAHGVHAQELDPRDAYTINTAGALHLYNAASRSGSRLFIQIGSAMEYGPATTPLDEHAPLAATDHYGITKSAASTLLFEHARRNSTPVVVLRPFNVYGPGERAGKLLPSIERAALARVELPMTDGAQVRDYVYVEDVARAVAAVVQATPTAIGGPRAFNVCSGVPTAVREFATLAARRLGAEDLLRFGAIERRARDCESLVGVPDAWRNFCREAAIDDPVTTPLERGLDTTLRGVNR